MNDEDLDSVPLSDLLAAVARRKEAVPYETEGELLAAEATGWGAIAILRERRTARSAQIFTFVVGPYRTRRTAEEARDVIVTNHRIAKRKGRSRTDLVRVEVKPIWKEPK